MTALSPLQRRAERPSVALAVRLADLAVKALVDEAMLTPKPGLVDMRGRGAHDDLSWPLMCHSACALHPFLRDMAQAGRTIADPYRLRRRIGAIGREAEAVMMAVTGGVNTHRGAIWALGLLVTAAAQCALANRRLDAASVAAHAGALARIDDPNAPARTGNKGELACLEHGVGGAREQARAGFPHVVKHGLPMLRLSRARGRRAAGTGQRAASRDGEPGRYVYAGARRCERARGHAGWCPARACGGGIASPDGRAALAALEARMRSLHVSPGGAADLLAATLLLDMLEREQVSDTGTETE